MKTYKTLAVVAAAWLATATAHAAISLPAGSTLITGQVSGASTTLLGLDHGFANEAGSNVTALAAGDVEYLTGDYNVGIDFFSDGRLQVWNNSGTASLAGNYSFLFSLGGLAQSLASFTALDVAEIAGGSYSLQVVDASTVSLTLSNLSFTGDFGSFTAQLGANAAAVPEPATLALAGLGLGLLALRRSGRGAA